MTEDRKELEKLRVGIARVAQGLGLAHEIPGQPEGDFTSLCRAAANHERGWHRLLACCSIEISASKHRDERLIDTCRELGRAEQAQQDALLYLREESGLDSPPAMRTRAIQRAISRLERDQA